MSAGARQANAARERQNREYFEQQVLRRLDRIIALLEPKPQQIEFSVTFPGDGGQTTAQAIRNELIKLGKYSTSNGGILGGY
jgi:hypothetical protein